MKKALILILIVLAGLGVYLIRVSNSNEISETELRERFRCDRITADVLATDIYCDNPQYYYEDKENNTIIDDNDFDDPRYKAMFKQ